MESIKAIGFDFGHGDTSLAYVYTQKGDLTSGEILTPTLFDLYRQHVQPTALAYDQNGQAIFGKKALVQGDAQTIELYFKRRPTDDPQFSKLIQAYVRTIYEYLIHTDQIVYDENVRVYIGCPSGWGKEPGTIELYENILNASGIPSLAVVKESRAALMQIIEGERKQLTLGQIGGAILVIDVGSSTTDFTVVINREDHPVDSGVDIGSALIDRLIFDYVLEQSEDRTEIEAQVQLKPSVRAQFLYACREAKEEYFSYPDLYETTPLEKLFRVGTHLLVDIKLDGPTMRGLLERPLPALQGEGWESRFREALKDVRSHILTTSGLVIQTVVLTGGATRMAFIESITKEVFTEAHVTRDTEPSTCIAHGLARWGRVDIRSSYFSDEIQSYISQEVRTQVTKRMPALIDAIANTLASKFIADLLTPALYRWREGSITTLNDLEAGLKADFSSWLKHPQDSIHSAVSPWLADLFKEIEPGIETIAKKYQISAGTVQFLGSISADGVSFISPDINDPTWISTIVGIIGGIVAFAVGIAILVLLDSLTGPVGMIATVIGYILAYISPFIGFEAGKDMMLNAMKERVIPVWIRKAALSKKKIERMGASEFNKIAEAFKSSLASDSPVMIDMQNKIFAALNAHIGEKIDRAKLLIL